MSPPSQTTGVDQLLRRAPSKSATEWHRSKDAQLRRGPPHRDQFGIRQHALALCLASWLGKLASGLTSTIPLPTAPAEQPMQMGVDASGGDDSSTVCDAVYYGHHITPPNVSDLPMLPMWKHVPLEASLTVSADRLRSWSRSIHPSNTAGSWCHRPCAQDLDQL